MLSLFRKKSDAKFVEAIRTSRRRRFIGAGLLFLLGLNALFFLVWEASDMYHRFLEFSTTSNTMNTPFEEQHKIIAQNVYFFYGVRVGHTINFALTTCVMSICIGIGLCRTNRRDRLLVEYYDRIQTLESHE